MQCEAVKPREAHHPSEESRSTRAVEWKKHKKPCLSGNVTAASHATRAVLRGKKKQQFCRDATETSLGSGRFLDKTAQSTAGQRAQYRPELGHSTSGALTAEHPTTPQEMPSAWESVRKD